MPISEEISVWVLPIKYLSFKMSCSFFESYEKLEKKIEMIMSIEKHYQNMLQKEIAS